jgi:hypothetical protein
VPPTAPWRAAPGPLGASSCRWSSCFRSGSPMAISTAIFLRALSAVVLVAAFAAGGEWIARNEQPPLKGGAVSFALGGAGVPRCCCPAHGFDSGWTTILLGLPRHRAGAGDAQRSYPVLGWLSRRRGGRGAWPGGLRSDHRRRRLLAKTPVFNWLSARLRRAGTRLRLCRLATGAHHQWAAAAGHGGVAALFALLTLAMLVRHAMNGGVIDSGCHDARRTGDLHADRHSAPAPCWSRIDMRSPSSVLRYGSIAIGVVSVLSIVIQHFLVLNPLFTNESTGGIPCCSTCCSSPISCRRSRPAGWRSTPGASGRNGMRRCWRGRGLARLRLCHAVGQAPVQGRVHRPVEPGSARLRPTPIRHFGWSWALAAGRRRG